MCPLKILPIEQIRELDAFTILNEPVKSIDLMERAAFECYSWINEKVHDISSFKIVCGMGNNGGDGLAIARMLHKDGHNVEVLYIRHTSEASQDNKINFKKVAEIEGLVVTEIFEEDSEIEFQEEEIIIDAILGSGLNKQVSGLIAEIIKQINESRGFVISIDIPSGLFADKPLPDAKTTPIVNADYTLTFQMPKLAFFIPENDKYVGKWEILPIGLDEGFIKSSRSNYFVTIDEDCRFIYKPRKRFSHKGSFGHALLIAGSLGKIGASILAAKSCLKAGAGLTTAHIPICGMEPMHISVPEVMVDIDDSETHISSLPELDRYNAIAIGPGLGLHEESVNALKLLIQEAKKPLILDADALNILSENKTWLSFLPPDSILTPHPKEFERLTSPVANHFNRLDILRAFAIRYKINVILKGAYSAIALSDGNIYFNPTGNPGMATGGTGDVLTGILLGLKASGYSARETCILGTWLHGKAADLAVKKTSEPSLVASDIIKYLGKAFLKLQ